LKVEFKKIPFQERNFETSFNGLTLKGIYFKESVDIVKIEADLFGKISVNCNRCAESFDRIIDEKLKLILTNKIYNGFDNEYDVIEILSERIDFNDIITSEIESIKLDFENICQNCQNEL